MEQEAMVNSDDERVVEDASILEILEQHQQTSCGQHHYYNYQQQQQKQLHELQKRLDGYEPDDVAKMKTKILTDATTNELMNQNAGNKNIHHMIDINESTSVTKDVVDADSLVNEVDQSIISILIEHQKHHKQYPQEQYHQTIIRNVEVVSEETIANPRNLCNGLMNEDKKFVEYYRVQQNTDDNEVSNSITEEVPIAVATSQLQPTVANFRHDLHPRHEHLRSEKKKKNTSNSNSHHSSDVIPGAVRVKGIVDSTSFHFDGEDQSISICQSGINQRFDDDDDDDGVSVIMTKAIRVHSMKIAKARIVKVSREGKMNIIKSNNELSLTSCVSNTSNNGLSHDIVSNFTTSASKMIHDLNEIPSHTRQWFRCNRLTIIMIIFMVVIVISASAIIVTLIVLLKNEKNKNDNTYNNNNTVQSSSLPTPAPIIYISATPTITRQSFTSRNELLYAIDIYLNETYENYTSTITTILNNTNGTNDNDEPKEVSTLLRSGGRRTSNNINETTSTNDNDNAMLMISLDEIESIYGKISYWDVSNITDFTYIFSIERNPLSYYFNDNINLWDVSLATNISFMFSGASHFNTDMSNWNTSNVIDMESLFKDAISFNQNLSNWNTFNVINMVEMFHNAISFEGVGIELWNISNVLNMKFIFHSCILMNRDLSLWDVSKLINARGMFYNATSFVGYNINNWNISSIKSTISMFYSAIRFDSNLSLWDTSNIVYTGGMFWDASSFRGIGLENWNTKSIISCEYMFYGARSFNTNVSTWFHNDMHNDNLTSFESIFYGTESFIGTGIEYWNVNMITNYNHMFHDSVLFNQNLSLWNISTTISDSISMISMFEGATSFQGVGLQNWDIDNNNNNIMTNMFCDTISFNQTYINNWNFSSYSMNDLMCII